MKSNEIRLGNYVYDTLGKVNKIDLDAITYIIKEPLNQVKPIPLTEEWLLNFGFEDRLLWCDNHKIDYEITERNEIIFFINGNGINLEYLHQLQNLYFALTGEELTMK